MTRNRNLTTKQHQQVLCNKYVSVIYCKECIHFTLLDSSPICTSLFVTEDNCMVLKLFSEKNHDIR